MAKACRKCGEAKEPSEFRANRRMRDGLSSWCAECHNAASRRWRDRQRELVAEALEARRRADLERLRAGVEERGNAISGYATAQKSGLSGGARACATPR